MELIDKYLPKQRMHTAIGDRNTDKEGAAADQDVVDNLASIFIKELLGV